MTNIFQKLAAVLGLFGLSLLFAYLTIEQPSGAFTQFWYGFVSLILLVGGVGAGGAFLMTWMIEHD